MYRWKQLFSLGFLINFEKAEISGISGKIFGVRHFRENFRGPEFPGKFSGSGISGKISEISEDEQKVQNSRKMSTVGCNGEISTKWVEEEQKNTKIPENINLQV